MISSTLPNWAEAFTAVLSVATLLAVVLAAVQIRHVNRQMHREFEMQYLIRFWTLMDRRSTRYKRTGRPARADVVLLQEYLALSDDQCALRSLGRVTDHTWAYWARDIRAMCSSKPMRDAMCRATPDEYLHLRRLAEDQKYDPLDRGWVWRLWRGL